jgi:flagellar motility protein MotE (MotC chaperone)
MKLQVKDYIAIAVVTVVTFPLLYFVMLFITGSVRIEFGPSKNEPKQEKVQLIKQSARKDSLAAVNSKTFQALQRERAELEKERQRLREQQDRIDILQSEVEAQQKKIAEERGKMEQLVAKSDSLGGKKIKELAKMYGAMRPSEAASILGTMEERLAAQIIRSINDDRQKAKILGSFSSEKAARISRIIGGQ